MTTMSLQVDDSGKGLWITRDHKPQIEIIRTAGIYLVYTEKIRIRRMVAEQG